MRCIKLTNPQFPKKKRKKEEEAEQKYLIMWLRYNQIKFQASANGGSRNKIEAANLKATGVSPGYPDLEIPYARKGYHGLRIELKRRKGGTLQPSQQEWLDFFNAQGYLALRANGWDEAKKIIEDYFSEQGWKENGVTMLQPGS